MVVGEKPNPWSALKANRVAAACTVKLAEPVSAFSVAVIVDVPLAAAIAMPVVEPTVAVAVVPEVQVTVPTGARVLESLRTSTAVYATVEPTATVSGLGVMRRETGTATPVTVKTVLPITEPDVAEIVVVPAPALVARPAAEIVATTVLLEAQVTCEVMSLVLVVVPVR
jgi:hypothetical protein